MPRGITLIEVVIAVGILLAIFAFGGFALSRFSIAAANVSSDREVLNAITSAARRARYGEDDTAWGVYIPYDETTRVTSTITIFSGTSYATRVVASDITLSVSDDIRFNSVDFSGSAPDATNSHEIVFAAQTGGTTQYGSLVLEWYDAERTLTVNSNGLAVR